MKNISVNGKSLFGIIDQLEDAQLSFDGLGCGLECAMIDDELEMYEKTECILRDSISMLKELAGYPQKAN